MGDEPPSGTVTLLFTDVEGSTQLLHELGDGYVAVLAEHRRLLRQAVVTHGGVEVDTQGDAFFFAFPRASDALAATVEAQRTLSDPSNSLLQGRVRVRMGVHTGEPTLTDEGYVGADVHLAARVMGAGHGGQVLVSEATARLVEAELRDLGEHRLKDIERPVRLFQLGDGRFPPLKTLNNSNLPLPQTPLLGRKKELADVLRLLRVERARLVTVTGPGGIGKTRFALEAAHELVEHFPHGVWFVDLSALRDPALVVPTITSTLGAKAELADHVADKHLLLVLDNFEQVVGAAPDVADVLRRCANVQVLVTGREPLRVAGERAYTLKPLAESPAVELFRARAVAVDPDFDAGWETLTALVERLDRLPLAIELAAAHVPALGADELLARLEQRLPLLTSRARDLPKRQRALRATIEWSYELLNEEEKQLLARLSVFAGGFTLAAAEHICEASVDSLESLVEKNLVAFVRDRYSMLETIREFAVSCLDDSGSNVVRARHAECFLSWAEARVPPFHRLNRLGAVAMRWFDAEHDNVRAALDWLGSSDNAERELRLVLATYAYAMRRGDGREVLLRSQGALERGATAPAILRARASWGVCMFGWRLGDYTTARRAARAARALFEQARAPATDRFWASFGLASVDSTLGHFASAARWYDEAARFAREARDDELLGAVTNALGNLALNQRQWGTARTLIEESLDINRRSGSAASVANDLVDLGFIALVGEKFDRAAELLHECLAICRAEGLTNDLFVWALEGISAVALARDNITIAARLLGSASRLRDELAIASDYYPIGEDIRGRTVNAVRDLLGEEGVEREFAVGASLTPEAAADEAALVD